MKNTYTLILMLLSLFMLAQKKKEINPKAKIISKELTNHLMAKDYDQVIELFDNKLKKKSPKERVQQMFLSLEESYGPLDSILEFFPNETAEATYYHQGLQFGNQKFDIIFGLDDENNISGIRLAGYTNKTPWVVPKFVNLDSFKTKEIIIGKELPLKGEFCLPNNPDKLVIAIMVHGSGPNGMNERLGPNELFKDLAYGLATNGIASIRYNKRTYDYPATLRKMAMEMTIDDIVINDAILAIKKAKSMGADQVILIGHSLGGHMAPKIATKESVDAVISLAGNSSQLADLIIPQYEYLMKNDSSSGITEFHMNTVKFQVKNLKERNYDSTTAGQLLPLGLPGSFWRSVQDYDPVKTAQKQKVPYLILNGGRDYQITPEEAKNWKNGSKHKLSTTIIYPKLNHMFFAGEGILLPSEYEKLGHLEPQVLSDITEWVSKL